VVNLYRSAEQSAATFPAGQPHGTCWTVIAPAVEGRSATQEDARARLVAALPDDADALLAVIAQTPLVIENKLVTRDFKKPWASAVARIAFLGDAAHPLRPTGEGTALAYEDAWTLGEILRSAEQAAPDSLRAYEEARRERVRAVSDAVQAQANQFYDTSKPYDRSIVPAAMKAHPMPYDFGKDPHSVSGSL